jgi:hypothetical protein
MDIKELDKKQFILLTLLITFVVSIATGIVTVSLMNQVPKSVPQTINNVIQRTIEKVTTVPAPVVTTNTTNDGSTDGKDTLWSLFSSNSDALVSIYPNVTKTITDTTATIPSSIDENSTNTEVTSDALPTALGQGVIISDIGLILVDSSLLTEDTLYKVILDKKDFNASVLKKFSNGFTILKISTITDKATEKTPTTIDTGKKIQ